MSTPTKGLIVGAKYRLEKPLGRGGMGSVWLAHHTQLGTPVAIKFIAAILAGSESARLRFEREAKAAAVLKSPHVVQVFDYGIDDELPYLVMELVEGEDLADRFKRVRRFDPRAFAPLLAQMAKGLQKAHDAGIVHRDLKPRNVYIAHGDEGEVVKILDFGIAKISGEVGETKTGELIGSPHYMSPEQAHGAKTVDHRSDLWSLAAITYRALTGRNAYEGEGVGEVLVKVSTQKPAPATEVAPDLSKDLDGFFDKAFARDPNARFQSAREFATAYFNVVGESSLNTWMALSSQRMSSVELPPLSGNAPAMQIPAKEGSASMPNLPPPSNEPSAATPAPFSATPSPMFTPVPPSFHTPSPPAAPAEMLDTAYFGREKQRSRRVLVGAGAAGLLVVGGFAVFMWTSSDPVSDAANAAATSVAALPAPLQASALPLPATTPSVSSQAAAPASSSRPADEAPAEPQPASKKSVSAAKGNTAVPVQSTATTTTKKRVKLGY